MNEAFSPPLLPVYFGVCTPGKKASCSCGIVGNIVKVILNQVFDKKLSVVGALVHVYLETTFEVYKCLINVRPRSDLLSSRARKLRVVI